MPIPSPPSGLAIVIVFGLSSANGEDEDADPACAGVFEGAGTFGGSGSGGEDIVDEEDAFSDNIGWALEGSNKVF